QLEIEHAHVALMRAVDALPVHRERDYDRIRRVLYRERLDLADSELAPWLHICLTAPQHDASYDHDGLDRRQSEQGPFERCQRVHPVLPRRVTSSERARSSSSITSVSAPIGTSARSP